LKDSAPAFPVSTSRIKEPKIDIRDEAGNRLYTGQKRGLKGVAVFLKLAAEKRLRKIGVLVASDKYGNIVYAKKMKKENVMRANKSFGFCFALIDALPENTVIVLHCGLETKYAFLSEIKKKWSFLYYKGLGFEKQIFIPVSYFSLWKARGATEDRTCPTSMK